MRALTEGSSNATPQSRVNLRANSNLNKAIIKRSNPALPNAIQSKMERSFNQDFSGVNIHKNSSKAIQLKAQAFTQGNDIHFAPGRFDPYSTEGQNLIGHELTHVVQQRNGRVSPIHSLANGLALNNQAHLEQEADVFGQKAANGKNVSEVGNVHQRPMAGVNAIQRKEETMGGEWDTEIFKLRKDKDTYQSPAPVADGLRGIDVLLKFTPNENVDAEKIALTQSVNSIRGGAPIAINTTVGNRSISSSDAITADGQSDEGEHIDRSASRNTPVYGAADLAAGNTLADTQMDNNPTSDPISLGDENLTGRPENATYQLGYRYQNAGSWSEQDAKFYDGPTLPNAATDSYQEFETTALAVKGIHEGTYYGSVKWGWRTDGAGNHTPISLAKVNDGIPSSSFMASAALWNHSTTSAGGATADLPVQSMGNVKDTPSLALREGSGTSHQILADLPRDTSVTIIDSSQSWLRVQLDATQDGLVINRHGRSATMTGNLLRGYVSGRYIQTHADYVR